MSRSPAFLNTPHDEALYEYYYRTQPMLFDPDSGQSRRLGDVANYFSLDPSPDSTYFLAVKIVRPYSRFAYDSTFTQEVELLDSSGRIIRTFPRIR